MLPYFFICWQVFDVALLFLLPLHPFGLPLSVTIRFSPCVLVFFFFSLSLCSTFHLFLLNSSFYSLWSALLVGVGLFLPIFFFIIKPLEMQHQQLKSWRSTTLSGPLPRSDVPSENKPAEGCRSRTWRCMHVLELAAGYNKVKRRFSSDGPRPFILILQQLTWAFSLRDKSLWGWASNIL